MKRALKTLGWQALKAAVWLLWVGLAVPLARVLADIAPVADVGWYRGYLSGFALVAIWPGLVLARRLPSGSSQ